MSSEQRVLIDRMRLFLSHWRGALIALTFVTLAAMLTGWELVPMSTWAIWGAFACTNSLCQAAVCRAMARADTLAEGVSRWQPWLLSSIAINGIIWGAAALMLHGTLFYAGVGYAAPIAVITYHGLRLQSALRNGMVL